MSGCIVTEVNQTLNSQSSSSQINCVRLTSTSIPPLSCSAENTNESNLIVDTFSNLDPSGLGALTMMENCEQVLSANLSTSLQLGEESALGRHDEIVVVQENMSDSFDRIANNTINEFCEIYTKPN